jgi:hypothetical protein
MIYILGGIHCDKKLYKKIIEILKEIKPDLVCFEELTHDKKTIKACEDFIKKKITLSEFKNITEFEKYWFDFTPYKELFLFLQKNKIKIYPIDHKLEKRIELIKFEKKILEKLNYGKDISNLKVKEEKMSVFERENEMVKNIIRGRKICKSNNTCVIVGINHIERIKDSLLYSGYRIKDISTSTPKEITKYIEKIYKYARANKIETLKIPPLVPIFILVFKKLKKFI